MRKNPLVLALFPVLLLRGAWTGGVPGRALAESWGHLFVAGQVQRWLAGCATPGRADLLRAPEGLPFWPVAPVSSAVQATISLLLGSGSEAEALALGAVMALLLWTTGLGLAAAARALGASPAGALLAGLLAQFHPFLLRNGDDAVIEVLALGPAAWWVALVVRGEERRHRRAALLLAGPAAWLTASTSPYYAVYAALALAAAAVIHRPSGSGNGWSRYRNRARFAQVSALGLLLALIPFLATETGDGGRLDPSLTRHGLHAEPDPLVYVGAEGEPVPLRGPPPRPTFARSSPAPPASDPPGLPRRIASRFPGGLAAAVAVLLALLTPGCRRLGLWALAVFCLGPGPLLVVRTLFPGSETTFVPLYSLLEAVPLLRTLGNPQRLTAAWILLASLAGARVLTARPRRGWLPAAFLVLETALVRPDLALPTTHLAPPSDLLDAVEGPFTVFPTGSGPFWHPGAPPKFDHYLAARAGRPLVRGYDRGDTGADLGLLVCLSAAARWPLGAEAARLGPEERLRCEEGRTAAREGGVQYVLLLDRLLSPEAAVEAHETARAWWGPPRVETARGAVYALEARSDVDGAP